MASSMITAAAAAAATASASSAATADELKGVDEEDGRHDNEAEDKEHDALNSSSSRSCANDPDFAIICVFLKKFHKDLGVAKPNFKQLQEWLTNTDEISDQLRLLHIKLLRKTRKTVHEKSWEMSLSKFCFTYSAQDAWEIERFGYKKSSLKVKLRILRELLESQFQRNAKFRAQILTMNADSLRSQPIGRDRLGHSYYFTQDDDANLRIYQDHLDEEIWQVVATTREELVNLIARLRGNEVVMPSTDIGVDEDTSSSNSDTTQMEKQPPPVEQDDSQEEETRVPNLRLKFTSNNGKVTVSSPTQTTASIATKRNLEEMDKSSPRSEEINIIKKARPSLLDVNRTKKPSRYEKTKSEEEDEEGEEDEVDEDEDDEEELSIEEEDIDSAAAEEDENEEKDIEEDSASDIDGGNEISEAIEEPTRVIRGEGSGKDCEGGNINVAFFADSELFEDGYSGTENAFVGAAIEEETLYVYGAGSGAECLVGNGKNDDSEVATTATKAATATPTTPTKTGDASGTFFFGEPGCHKLSPIKPTTPTNDAEDIHADDAKSLTTDNKAQSTKVDNELASEKVKATADVEIKDKNMFMKETNASSGKENNKNIKATDDKNNAIDEQAAPTIKDETVKETSNGDDIDCCKNIQQGNSKGKCNVEMKKSDELATEERLKMKDAREDNEKLEKGVENTRDEKLQKIALNKDDTELQEVGENVQREKLQKYVGTADNIGHEKGAGLKNATGEKLKKYQGNVVGENIKNNTQKAANEQLEKGDIAVHEMEKNLDDEQQAKSKENAAEGYMGKSIEKVVDGKLEKSYAKVAEDNRKTIKEKVSDEKLVKSIENENSSLEQSIKKAADINGKPKDNVEANEDVTIAASSKDPDEGQAIKSEETTKENMKSEDEVKTKGASDMNKKLTFLQKEETKKEIDDKVDEEISSIDTITGCTSKGGAKEEETNHDAREKTNTVEENDSMVTEKLTAIENAIGNDKLHKLEISDRSIPDESENRMEALKERIEKKPHQRQEKKRKQQPIQDQKEQTREQNRDQKDQSPAPEQHHHKLSKEEGKIADHTPHIQSIDKSKALLIKTPVEEKCVSTSTKPSTSNPLCSSLQSTQSKYLPSSTPTTVAQPIINRKRRLEEIPPPPPASHRLSTSESEIELQSEQQEEFPASEDDLDPAGKRLKMRPKLTNIEVRQKVEAQKGCLEETTSSSGEEDPRRRRKIIPQRRQIERCVKNLKVAHEAAAAKRESNLAQAAKEAENVLALAEEKEAIPLNLTSPTNPLAFPATFTSTATSRTPFMNSAVVVPPTSAVKMPPPPPPAPLPAVITSTLGSVPVAASTSKPCAAPVPLSEPKATTVVPSPPTVRQKPTLAEIIEKKLKKKCEKIGATELGETLKTPLVSTILTATATDTPQSNTNDSNTVAAVSLPKKSPITKPLKKNLLTQLRQEESDEESIPRKRTISDASGSAPPTITIAATPTIKAEVVKKIESFFVEDRVEGAPERKRTPERKMAQPKSTDRKSVERRLPTRKMPERKTPERRAPDHKTSERKLPDRMTPERKTPERQRKRRSSEEVKITSKMETEGNKEMKYETLEEMETKIETFVIKKERSPSPVEQVVETAAAGRRSSRRSAASVVYAELPQPKRTRGGAKAMSTTTAMATPAASPKKVNVKEEKASGVKTEMSRVEDSAKAGDKRVAPSTKELSSTQSLKEVIKQKEVATTTVKTKEVSKENAKEAKKSKQTPNTRTQQDSKKEEDELKTKLEIKEAEFSTPKEKGGKTSGSTTTPVTPTLNITSPDKYTSDSTPTSSARGRGVRSKLEVDATNIIQTIDSETPVRMSRRIAQQKIREEAERRKLEEIALRTMKQELKKKKKAEKQSDPTVVEPSEPSSSDESEVELKKKAKKKYPGKDGWSSGSEEQEEPEEEDEPPQSDHGSPLFRSDHEFSPESDLEDDTQVVPMKRARTARKEDADEDDERDEHACQKCGKSDHPEWILLCDKCDKGYHCSCLSPVLFYIPEGDWYCPPCQQEQLISALEKQLNDFDEFVEQKRVQEEENKRLAEEAERIEKERLENEKQLQKEHKERKKQKKKSRQRDENGKEGDKDNESGASVTSDDVVGEEKSKTRPAKESDDDSDDDKPLLRVKSASNRKIRSEGQRDSHKRHKRRRGDGRSRRRAAARGIATRRRHRNTSDSGTGSGSANGSGSCSDSSSGSGSSSSSSSSSLSASDNEPIYKLRKRRQINVSYRLNEYDDLINSALKKEMDALAGAGNLGRGKDISTIIEADKEKARQQDLKKVGEGEDIVGTNAEKSEKLKVEQDYETRLGKDDETKVEKDRQLKVESDEKKNDEDKEENDKYGNVAKAENPEAQKKTKNNKENKPRTDDGESSDEILKRKAKPKPTAKKKKPRKLTTLDISSEEDNASDEDFKTSSFEDEEDTSISASTASDSSLEVFRRRGKKNKKKRKAARRVVRQRRKDRRFIVNDSDEDEEEDRPKMKKKRKDDTDYTDTDTDSEASENLEDVDSADLCDDTTSESDGAWYPSKRKKGNTSQRKSGNKSVAVARKSPKLKKQPVKKPKKVEYSDDDISESEEEEDDDDDDIHCGKGSGKQPRSQPLIPSKSTKGKGKGKGKTSNSKKKKKKQSEDEDDSLSDSEDSTRRTRGRRYAYLEDFDDESSDGGIKPGVQRPDTPPEERQKFIQRQEEIKRMLAEKNAEGAKLAATPRLTPIKADGDKDKRSPAKNDSLSTVPLSVIRQAKVLDVDYLQRKGDIGGDLDHVDEVDEFDDADLPDDFPEDMDEDTIARMVEEEEELSAAAAARELPPPDEVLRTPLKQTMNKPKEAPLTPQAPAPATVTAPPHIAAAVAAAAAVANLTANASAAVAAASASSVQKPSHHINPSLAALAQMPGGVSTAAAATAAAAAAAAAAVHHMSSMGSGLQEPMRKRLPMPTMHPPLLRHQFPPHGANMPLAHLLQRHPSAAPPSTHLLQNALSTPLGQPLNRSNFPPQHMPRLPAGMSMEQMLAAQHIMSAAATARHNLPPTSQPLPSAPGARDQIHSSGALGGGGASGSSNSSGNSGAVAAAIAAATAVAAASGANKLQTEPKPRGRRKKITPLRDTLQKQQAAAAVTAATAHSDKSKDPTSNNAGAGGGSGNGGGVIKSVVSATASAPPQPSQLFKEQSSGPSVSSAPVSQASVITRMPQHSAAATHASIARAMSNLYAGADVARFFAPPTSLSSVAGPRPPHCMQRHRDVQGMPAMPHSTGMRQSYGPPPPLRGSAPNHAQHPHAGSGERQTYHAPGDHHMPSGMGASMYGGPPPPARHSTSHLNPYRPPIYGNPNFVPRGPGIPNLRVPGSGGSEFPGGPRSYAPYGYYPPPPPLTNPHGPPMPRHPPSSTAGPSRGSSGPSSAAPATTPSPTSPAGSAAAHTSAPATVSTAATIKSNAITTTVTNITAKPSSVIVSAPPTNASASLNANVARNVVQKSPIPTPTITQTPTYSGTKPPTQTQIPPTPKTTACSTPATSSSSNSLSMPSRVIVTEPADVSTRAAAIVNSTKGGVVKPIITAPIDINEPSQPPRKKLTTLETYATAQTKSPLVIAGESSGSRSSPGGMQADAADDSSSAHGTSSTAVPADRNEGQASEFSGLVSYFSSQHDDYNT
ncbi:titin homolog [Eurosta solidaginis]|uniref:titin homolog n=1 Tax=Eurosta solidaginis TaxID=178769 RepID=UPI0035316353